MSVITSVTRGGEVYTPAFVMEIDQSHCIGCGRCIENCPTGIHVVEVFQYVRGEL